MIIKNKKSHFKESILNLIAIFLVLDVYCVWLREYKLGDYFFSYINIVLISCYLLISKIKISKRDFFVILILISLCILSTVIKGSEIEYVVLVGIGFSVAYLMMKKLKTTGKSILDKIAKVIVVISTISLFFYILGSVLNILPGKSYVDFYWGGNRHVITYYNLYFESQGEVLLLNTWKLIRNCACFTEAPMFGFLVSAALAYELLISEKKSKANVIILILASITTTSITSIVATIITILFYFLLIAFNKKKTVKWIRYFIIISLPVLLALGVCLCILLYSTKITYGGASYNIRIDDITTCFNLFISHPIFGIGIGNYDPIVKNISSQSRNGSNGMSTAILVLMAQSGISLLIWPFLRLLRNKYSLSQYAYLAVIFFLLMFTNIPYKMIIVVLSYEVLLNDMKMARRGFHTETQAVKNGIKYAYNNGIAEGSVNKIKIIKRTMYGRNSFELLRAKMLFHESLYA